MKFRVTFKKGYQKTIEETKDEVEKKLLDQNVKILYSCCESAVVFMVESYEEEKWKNAGEFLFYNTY